MDSSPLDLHEEGLTLVFGPQDTNINEASSKSLRSSLLNTPELQWILKILPTLQQYVQPLITSIPELKASHFQEHINALVGWLRRGEFPKELLPLPKAIILPLVVITQLAQHFTFVKKLSPDLTPAETLQTAYRRPTKVVGLCTGFLSSAAVASSENSAELEKHGAAAIRIAMVIGAVLDAEDAATVSQNKRKSIGVESIIRFLDSDPNFQFPETSLLAFQLLSASGEEADKAAKLHHVAARAMLTDQPDWHQLFTSLESSQPPKSLVTTFGSQHFAPQWFVRQLGPRLVQGADFDGFASPLPIGFYRLNNAADENAVAVIGMACHLPGGDDLDGFWGTLCAGNSQHVEIPEDRVDFSTSAWRDLDPKKKWFGNFVENYDAFDHKFFKKSSREMASTDPQQRLMLQVAYQAVQQSGYFSMPSPDMQIGCYVGIGVTDYEGNVACHPATAYTATGNLRAFASGKISHHFGWTGPGVSFDTACSSSAVAIHYACQAILSGECSAALAGGANVMTRPEWYQNLDGATFLSPTGQCKPFDVKADGYCRGEGAGAVLLKKLSTAIKDGNQVLGVIPASAVNQNENCSAITAPSVLSLSDVFRTVIRKAGLDPKQISVVEAHGTGTQVGDRAEYDSIRKVLGGEDREDNLNLGSVKGLIGHLECASGVAALIKALLMISNGTIPPQPSFQVINPKLNALPTDKIEIAARQKQWDSDFRAVLLNNYGASGSNSSLVVTQAPNKYRKASQKLLTRPIDSKRPFWVCGLDEQSLRAYSAKLLQFVTSKESNDNRFTIENLSFQLFRQSNRSLNQALIFSCSSVDELKEKLSGFAAKNGDLSPTPRQETRPVVLCFGGQISTFVGLDREVFDQCRVLRSHLDRCNDICIQLGVGSIYPGIFDKTPVENVVSLQTMLFAIQYSCARSWIDSGVKVAAVVGHSFGDLTAMCISGALSVDDTLKMIAGRASIIQDQWGPEKGSMMAVEGAQDDVERLLRATSTSNPEETAPTIACFNGPRSFTLAGSTRAIELLKETLSSNSSFSGLRSKQLKVTNAFHSTLVDSLMTDLEKVGEDLIIREPTIPHERAVQDGQNALLTPKTVASHMRDPVYFNDAVQRLAKRYPSSIWLEAGSGSGVTMMASRALGSPKSSHFQSVNITSAGAPQQLTDDTMALWKQGLDTTFWAHHVEQTSEYVPLLLPPYQFEKAKHWLMNKKPQEKVLPPVQVAQAAPTSLWTFLGYQDDAQTQARFQINTSSDKYLPYVSAHMIAQTAPICPSAFMYSIAMGSLKSIMSESENSTLQPELQGMENNIPMCIDPSRSFWLDTERSEADMYTWNWKISSTSGVDSDVTLHVSGRIAFRTAEATAYDFAKYERLVDRKRGLALLDGPDAEQAIQGGRNIYKAFAGVVKYNHEEYKGVEKVTTRGDETAARIIRNDEKATDFNVGLADTFCQVAGIFWNCMFDAEDGEMFLSNKVDQWMSSPTFPHDSRPKAWELYVRHHHISAKDHMSDVFVFDQVSGKLAWIILGLHFVRVPINAISRLLARLSPGCNAPQTNNNNTLPSAPAEAPIMNSSKTISLPNPSKSVKTILPPKIQPVAKKNEPPQRDISGGIRDLLCNILGLEPGEIKSNSDLVEIGIDSLLAMEVAREVENEFKVKLETEELLELTDFQSLVTTVQKKLGIFPGGAVDDHGILTPAGSITPENSVFEQGNAGVPETDGNHTTANGYASPIPNSTILDTFNETKQLTDKFIEANKLSGYSNNVHPKHNELVVIHIVDAFEQMGCPIRTAKDGQVLERVSYLPKHEQVIEVFYDLLEKARIVDIDSTTITRTGISVPSKSATVLLQELLRDSPDHSFDYKLTSQIGFKLADCLTGKTEGTQLLFGTQEGRELAAGWYGKAPMNTAWITQIEHFLKQLLLKLPLGDTPINILEMGAGTGGTTSRLVPLFIESGVPFQYTVTDISPSLVAGLRKRFRSNPSMRFEVLDLEKTPSAELLHSQHVVLATNCVHATQSLARTTKNVHDLLRPDGFLMMLEMTNIVPWIDLVFGVVDGWWLFNDGRKHALVDTDVWEDELQSNGYGHVDWSDGHLPESSIQRIIIALASGPSYDRVPVLPNPLANKPADFPDRKAVVDSFVQKHTQNFTAPFSTTKSDGKTNADRCVVITGGTGSLGAHLVAYFALQPNVSKVICLNRVSQMDGSLRQKQILESRGLNLEPKILSKLEIIESDTTTPMLGLSKAVYQEIVSKATDIVHNAWPMSLTRPVRLFEPQFKTMRNLINLAHICACQSRPRKQKIGFQLVSSIAVVGSYPFKSGKALVPEAKMTVDSVLPIGYAEAKLVCEYMLDETLHKYPNDFHTMTVRLGQIAGSKTSGYWNPVEHLAQLVKSSQTLEALPDLEGVLSWCPVNDLAATCGEILLGDSKAYPMYHIENPVRQPWREMIRFIADALDLPHSSIIPYNEWVSRVRQFPPSLAASENPAARLVEFFSKDFIHMSCGGLILDTALSKEHSNTLTNLGPVSKTLVIQYVQAWRAMGFLR